MTSRNFDFKDISKVFDLDFISKSEGDHLFDTVRKDSHNLTMEGLLTMLEKRVIRTGYDWIPDFQRGLVWSLKQKQDLILSLLQELPIGSFYINHTDLDDRELTRKLDGVLCDGQQRVNAILEFLFNGFPVIVDGKEFFCKDLPRVDFRRIMRSGVLVYETFIENEPDLIDFYIKINQGNTLHTEAEIQKARDVKSQSMSKRL